MTLHLALRLIIKSQGIEIISKPRLIYYLMDYQAFEEIPEAKYIIKCMIDDGYIDTLHEVGYWCPTCQRICERYINKTGFRADMVSAITNCFVFSFGWTTELPDAVIHDPIRDLTFAPKPKKMSASERKKLMSPVKLAKYNPSDSKALSDFILSRFERDGFEEEKFGLQLEFIDIRVNNDYSIEIKYKVHKLNVSIFLKFEIFKEESTTPSQIGIVGGEVLGSIIAPYNVPKDKTDVIITNMPIKEISKLKIYPILR